MALFIAGLFASCQNTPTAQTEEFAAISPTAPGFTYTGRFDFTDSAAVRFAWSGSQIQCRFEGTRCVLRMDCIPQGKEADGSSRANYFRIAIDDRPPFILVTEEGKTEYLLADSLPEGAHTLSVFKRTEAEVGTAVFRGLKLSPGKSLLQPAALPSLKIEFIGNSITCGYGNEGENRDCHFSSETENAWETYSAITARNLKAQYVSVCFSGRGVVQNYNRSTIGTMPELFEKIVPGEDTSPWDFSQYIPDIVVINLGTNDFAHANPDPASFVSAYAHFLQTIRSHYPQAKIVCLTGPMMTNDGSRKPISTLKKHIDEAISRLRTNGQEDIFRFDLTTQGSLGYGCDWHPNLAQHRLNADELTAFLRSLEK
ncbi:MAG: SGNH/GDSL hydrolase family protein [Bacteroidia bacterium]